MACGHRAIAALNANDLSAVWSDCQAKPSQAASWPGMAIRRARWLGRTLKIIVLFILTQVLRNTTYDPLAHREGRHLQRRTFGGAGAGSANRVRHLIRRRPGHHARPARVRTARCSLHWRRRGSAELPFASGDSRKRWPGPGWKATSSNPHSGAPKGDRPLS